MVRRDFIKVLVLQAQERFPDGKKIPARFGQTDKVSLASLGRGISAIDWMWMLDFAGGVFLDDKVCES